MNRLGAELGAACDARARNELHSLAGERDPDMAAEGLLAWSSRQEQLGRLEAAAAGYAVLAGEGIPEVTRARAAARMAAVNGSGSSGLRAEFLLRRLARDASDPVMLAGMTFGSAVFATARTGILSNLLSRPATGWFARGLGARALASAGAFALEVPAFWAGTKGLNELINPGSQRWDFDTNLRELAGLGLTLGALKLTGAAATGLSGLGRNPATAGLMRSDPLTAALHQAGMFSGILLGHRLEEAAGLRQAVDGATTFTDSLAMLIQFNVGGRLAGELTGTRFRAFQQELDLRSRALEAETRGPSPWNLGPARAFAFGAAGPVSLVRPGKTFDFSRPTIMHMASSGEGAGSNSGLPPAAPAREVGIRTDLQPTLPRRTNRTPNDRFEPTMSPPEILEAVASQAVHGEIVSRLEEVRDLNDTDYPLLGAAVGEALRSRLDQITSHPDYQRLRPLAERDLLDIDFRDVPRPEDLAKPFRDALDVAAQLMQITQFALRTNQGDLLHAVRGRLAPRDPVVYQELLSLIRLVKGPRLLLPENGRARGGEVLGPDAAILSHGTGDMASTLKVPMHLAVPGGRPWYARYFATDADARIVDGIRTTGRNPNFKKPIFHNYEGDLPIEAVYNRDELARILFRTVQVQLLNVPSVVLDRMFNEEFVVNLPENAILVSAIGGLLDAGAGRPQLPFQFFRERLDRFGREDVEIVTMAGYIPGDKLWRGERVRVNFSAREDLPARKSQPRPAADLIARMFTGQPNYASEHLMATVSHWQPSNNLGKVAKNIFTLLVGYRAAQLARDLVQQQEGLARENPRFRELSDTFGGRYLAMRDEVWITMQELLVYNEGIKRNRAFYTAEVEQDYLNCSNIEFERLAEVIRRGRELSMREATPESLREFLVQNVMSPREAVASTRNPRRGIAQVLYEDWVARGLPYTYDEIGPKDTYEGVNSLELFIRFYNHPSVAIEHQRVPDEIYEMVRAFLGRAIEPAPRVSKYLRRALDRRADDFDAREIQDTLRKAGINTQRIRQLLEGRSEAALATLDREIGRLWISQARWKAEMERRRDPEPFENEFYRQAEVVKAVEEALVRGNPVNIVRGRIAFGPYQNAFVIERQDGSEKVPTHQAFLRLGLSEVMPRLTSLGLFLRSFAPEDNVEIDVRIPDVGTNVANLEKLLEVEMTGREIVRAFRRQRSGSVRLMIERKTDEEEMPVRGAPTDRFYDSLLSLGRWILGREEGPLAREEVRQLLRVPRHETASALDAVVRNGSGWVMLLGPTYGPVQGGIRAMLTRPEKSVLIGVYAGDQLVDTFAVYRYDRNEARVLYHQNLDKFARSLPDHEAYRSLNAIHYFNGFPLETFIADYNIYAERSGIGVTRVAPIPIRYAPLEQGLVGKVAGVNPAILKLFLAQAGAERDQLLREVLPIYEMTPEAGEPAFQGVVQPYLERYASENRVALEGNPLFRIFQRFDFLRRKPRGG